MTRFEGEYEFVSMKSSCVKELTMLSAISRCNAVIIPCVAIFTVFDCVASDIAYMPMQSDIIGMASWYGAKYRGRKTASGERFDPSDFTAAHPSLPMGTLVEVSRPERNRSVVVRVNDRGPGGGRILDVSEAAARRLALIGEGTAMVSVRVIGSAD